MSGTTTFSPSGRGAAEKVLIVGIVALLVAVWIKKELNYEAHQKNELHFRAKDPTKMVATPTQAEQHQKNKRK